ncbi:MAG: YafY family transcriptional regulator [Jatrophihabitans sp.]|nr:MAG: YafY family transcriptional regulator [Jatrophihabitans sp.]
MTAPEQRVPRLLAMVPYFLARPGVSTAQAAADFGISEKQLIKDLDLLWVCGLPGHGPGDLIDLSYEGGTVSIIFDAGMSRPLRLTGEEALVLVVALRTLAEIPGMASSDAVQRALAKVEAAAGGAVADSTVTIELDAIQRLQPVLQRSLAERRALALRYYTAARNETTERMVDPLRMFDADGRSYLEAWCRSAEGVRVFRVDRIEDVQILDEPAAPPADLELRDLAEGVFRPAAEHLLVELELSPAYAWVADYYPVETAQEVDDHAPGRLRIGLRVSEPAWVQALALGSGGEVRVLSPGWLADAVRTDAASALAAYDGK